MKTKTRRILRSALATLVAAALVAVVVLFFFPWSPLNCRRGEVDINTGTLRFSRYLFFCKVSETVEDSRLTEVLPRDLVRNAEPDWRRVNTFSPGVHRSPHYVFHGAVGQIRTLALLWELYKFPQEAKQKTGLQLLALWKHDGSDVLADEYLVELHEELMNSDDPSPIIGKLSKLGMPLIEKDGDRVRYTVFNPNGQPLDRFQAYLDDQGNVIKDGIWESWHPNGRRQVYGHYKDGIVHGRRFAWDRGGNLQSIEGFRDGELVEYQSENLVDHPDYETAQELSKRVQE